VPNAGWSTRARRATVTASIGTHNPRHAEYRILDVSHSAAAPTTAYAA
jgi:hypothetical protein